MFVCHVLDGTAGLPLRHTLLRMKQDADLDALVRQRIRGLRTSLGWSLDELAARSYLSPSTLSRIETGHRRIALDQLTPIARALGTTLDQLVESDDDADVVIRPLRDEARGMTTWLLSRTGAPRGMTIAKLRVTRKVPARLRVHPGRDWFTVLSGTIVLRLGGRTILVRAGEAAEFSTMEPHAFGVREEAAEILCILDHDGTRTHLGRPTPSPRPAPRRPDRSGSAADRKSAGGPGLARPDGGGSPSGTGASGAGAKAVRDSPISPALPDHTLWGHRTGGRASAATG